MSDSEEEEYEFTVMDTPNVERGGKMISDHDWHDKVLWRYGRAGNDNPAKTVQASVHA